MATVATADINASAVTYAKIQAVTDARLLGRSAGSAGDVQEITVGSGLSLSAGALTASGGSDPWTFLKLTGNFLTSSTTVADISNGVLLGFTPAANTAYEFYGILYLRTATATVNPRVGLAWSTGLTDGVARIETSQSATTVQDVCGNINAALLAAVGGLANNTQSWPCTVWGTLRAGAGPSGNTRLQMSTETAGTAVQAMTGSWLRYRTI